MRASCRAGSRSEALSFCTYNIHSRIWMSLLRQEPCRQYHSDVEVAHGSYRSLLWVPHRSFGWTHIHCKTRWNSPHPSMHRTHDWSPSNLCSERCENRDKLRSHDLVLLHAEFEENQTYFPPPFWSNFWSILGHFWVFFADLQNDLQNYIQKLFIIFTFSFFLYIKSF